MLIQQIKKEPYSFVHNLKNDFGTVSVKTVIYSKIILQEDYESDINFAGNFSFIKPDH